MQFTKNSLEGAIYSETTASALPLFPYNFIYPFIYLFIYNRAVVGDIRGYTSRDF